MRRGSASHTRRRGRAIRGKDRRHLWSARYGTEHLQVNERFDPNLRARARGVLPEHTSTSMETKGLTKLESAE